MSEGTILVVCFASGVSFILGWLYGRRDAASQPRVVTVVRSEASDVQVATQAEWHSETLPSKPQGSPNLLPEQTRIPGMEEFLHDDPGFDDFTFMQRATTICFAVSRALTSGEFDLIRDLVSDRLFRQWTASSASLPPAFPPGKLDLTLAAAQHDPAGYRLTVRIDETQASSPDQTAPTILTEWWDFIRGSGRHWTRCPSCGGPIKDSGQTACQFCQAILPTGAIDWIVDSVMVRPSDANAAA